MSAHHLVMDITEGHGAEAEHGALGKHWFIQAIEALLADDAIHYRVALANRYLEKIESSEHYIDPELVHDLRSIVDELHNRTRCIEESLSPEEELDLTARLHDLYVDSRNGVLIW